jgi:S1-C subfamily serine protease
MLAAGSSFVIAPGYLVTNAHVVVGARSIIVQTSGSSFDASTLAGRCAAGRIPNAPARFSFTE